MTYYIVTKDNCPWCDKAKWLLKEHFEEYVTLNITEFPPLVQLLKGSGIKTVPQIWDKNMNLIGGYQELALKFSQKEATIT